MFFFFVLFFYMAKVYDKNYLTVQIVAVWMDLGGADRRLSGLSLDLGLGHMCFTPKFWYCFAL